MMEKQDKKDVRWFVKWYKPKDRLLHFLMANKNKLMEEIYDSLLKGDPNPRKAVELSCGILRLWLREDAVMELSAQFLRHVKDKVDSRPLWMFEAVIEEGSKPGAELDAARLKDALERSWRYVNGTLALHAAYREILSYDLAGAAMDASDIVRFSNPEQGLEVREPLEMEEQRWQLDHIKQTFGNVFATK